MHLAPVIISFILTANVADIVGRNELLVIVACH